MSQVTLADYNEHKRKTLDRLTATASRRVLKLYKKILKDRLPEILKRLEDDKPFNLDFTKKEEAVLENIFEKHRQKVTYASVADGLREVPRDNTKKLNSWADYPINYPIEKTLTTLETKEVESVAKRIEEKMGEKQPRFFMELIGQTKKSFLKQIEKAYLYSASDWLEGEGTIKEVKERLSKSLLRTKSGVDRVFRTETTRYFNEGRDEYFKGATRVTHYQVFAITDGRTSKICEDRHKFVFPKEKSHLRKYRPPFHPNCRTILRPLMERIGSHKQRIADGMAMDESRFEKLPMGWAN